MWLLLTIVLTIISLSSSQVINPFGNRAPFIAWEHYLQECGAEMPHQCSGSKKALGQSCMFDNDCIAPAVCQKSKCQCVKGHVPYKERCVRAPTLDQQCIEGQCAQPYVCTRRDICECPRSMERQDGGCDSKCRWNQILVDGECLLLVRLGQTCKASLQCNTAFAYCGDDLKCQCVPGTRQSGDRCEANPMCPDRSAPLTQNGVFAKCRGQTCASNQLPFTPPRLKLDSCQDGYYCVFPSYQDADGFCCREVPYCPMGEALINKNCLNPRNEAERCPLETHHCYAASRGTHCCPLPCPSLGARASVVVNNGQCWERRGLKERCNVTAQCPGPARCMNGTCDCPEGFKYQFGPTGEKCQKQCVNGQVLVGAECLAMALPGAVCTNSAQCTAGTKCVAGICDCPCGTIAYNGNCIDVPECPNFGNGIYDPLKNRQGVLIECSPTNFRPNSPPPCPEKSFCHRAAIYSGGICCPMPEATCLGGRLPPRNRDNDPTFCDFSGNSSMTIFCPRGQYCYDYTIALMPSQATNTARRGVCCVLAVVGGIGGGRQGGFGYYGGTQWGQQQPQSQVLQGSISSNGGGSTSVCPSGGQMKVDSSGHPVRCPFYAYQGHCGANYSCYLHPSPSARFVNHEGVCCSSWRRYRK